MPFDLVWWKKKRDWRWLWLRTKEVRFTAPITAVDLKSITVARPVEGAFVKLLEAEKRERA